MKQFRQKATLVFMLGLMVSTMGIQTARALDTQFYSGNDILFYDPDACPSANGSGAALPAVDSTASEDKNAEIIFKYLISTSFTGLGGKSFNAIQAAGALGNFYQESHFDPGAIEQPSGEGHGLAQWSFDRKTKLFAFAAEKGTTWNTMSLQLALIEKEINASYGKSLLNAGFADVTTPKDASYIFQKIYEGAGIPAQSVRDGAAIKYYEKFKGLTPAPGAVSMDGSNTCAPKEGGSNFSNDGFVIYDQCDARWGTRPYGTTGKTTCSSGCGPSSMAMIITALTGKTVTPKDTIDYANERGMYIPGAGSSWDVTPVLAKNWGLKAENIPNTVEAINKVLKSGGLVITSGIGAAPFTSAGHYITIRGIGDDGKWKIGDSNGKKGQANSLKTWEPRGILDIAAGGNIWAITK